MFRLYRTNAKLAQQELADKCHCVKSEISKIELGARRAPHRVVELADLATGAGGELVEMFGDISWDGVKEGYPEYIKREAVATRIQAYEALAVGALLRTEKYARAVITGRMPDAKPDAVEDLVSTVMNRQEIFTREDAPDLLLVMHESSLRHCVGGADVHRAQLDALITAAGRPEVAIRVVPADSPVCAGLACSFVILSFDDQPDVAYAEDPVIGRLTDSPDRVAGFVSEFDAVRAYALPVQASLELISQVREES
jgi:transcriptional regulator with XRE-family HTH domain